MHEARRCGIAPRSETLDAVEAHTTLVHGSLADPVTTTVHAALAACATPAERARRVLDLLLADAGARDGELLCRPGGVARVAATREGLSTPDTLDVLARLAEGAREEADTMLQDCVLSLDGPAADDEAPSSIWPIVLSCVRSRGSVVVGVATLHFDSSAAVRLPFESASAAAAALLDCGDVAGPQTTSGPLTKASR